MARVSLHAMRQTAERFSGAIVPAFLWLWLCNHLRAAWTLNAQYNFGWAVPFLAVFLFYLRWLNRPQSSPAAARNAAIASAILLGLLLPLRAIEEANPDWRLLSWTLALIAVGYSLLALSRAGGGAWVRHFAFPICFTLVAVPWPVRLENIVVQNLSRAVAYVAVEIAGWTGVGAYQLGNVIQLHNGFVGVDEACSGVKTLQAAIMVTLVLGELLRMSGGRRVLLVCVGCGWVFACNIMRATALVVIAARDGTDALHQWHDTIGMAVVIIGMAGLLGFGWLLGRGAPTNGTSQPIVDLPPAHHVHISGVFAGLIWLGLVFAATELWYRSHERHLIAQPAWQAHWPIEDGRGREMPIADTTRAILHYDSAKSAGWQDPPAVTWWGFFGRWEPRRAALQLVRSHSPEICLPAVGRTFLRELDPVVAETSKLPLNFRAFEFVENRRPLFVFVCIQEDKRPPGAPQLMPNDFSAVSRVQAALNGERNLGQRLLELAVIGLPDAASATRALQATVREVVDSPVTD